MAGAVPEEDVSAPLCHQEWRSLTFLHWSYDIETVQRLLPSCLTVDDRDGKAWVGLTPFMVHRLRLPGLPPLPMVSTYPETNLRTYVRDPDGVDGIWFFALEVESVPTTIAARLGGVPYNVASMSVEEGELVRYVSRRRGADDVGHDITVAPGAPIDHPSDLDHFLTGRWRAFSRIPGGLATVPVRHEPWPLHQAQVVALEETLTRAAGLPTPGEPALVHYSPGVDATLGLPRLRRI